MHVSGYDILMNKVVFSDMKLAGIIFICCGFLLVLTATHWAAMLRNIIRWVADMVWHIQRLRPFSAGGDLHKTLSLVWLLK